MNLVKLIALKRICYRWLCDIGVVRCQNLGSSVQEAPAIVEFGESQMYTDLPLLITFVGTYTNVLQWYNLTVVRG